ncbi:hypothetical protein AHALO_1691 [Malaciobacter halophilus]|uniref:helix-turn-helix domain-containing protein n=1 Tax=Malaciobacter halophilus TaxID=197482 RepID=UPI000E0BF03E|nr:helix-turn-helix domain-containing protein [Malaciobacter halophilus]AXH09727.1 hypothetical protein AHALO_1355 [Malaciobacter halophilus]AXH10057.1 hypothetical protein AHALO_1691 [Malaciobacter halophilus]
MRKDVLENKRKILIAISNLHKGGKPININQIAKETNMTWRTVKRYFTNNFYLQGV